MLKKWLNDNGVKYEDYFIDKDPHAAQTLVSQSGQMSVPFSTVEYEDGSVDKILGFDREKFSIALAKQ